MPVSKKNPKRKGKKRKARNQLDPRIRDFIVDEIAKLLQDVEPGILWDHSLFKRHGKLTTLPNGLDMVFSWRDEDLLSIETILSGAGVTVKIRHLITDQEVTCQTLAP